jgi:hypothetical protein
MLDLLRAHDDEAVRARIKGEVEEMCGRFPVPGIG